jgi:hypothetical protein
MSTTEPNPGLEHHTRYQMSTTSSSPLSTPAIFRPWQGLNADALYWSEDGRIDCAEHTPYPGSDTWVKDRFMPMHFDEVIEFAATTGQQPACEICGRGPVLDSSNEAQLYIERSLNQVGGDHARALDLILEASYISSEAKGIAAEVLG